MEPWIDLNADLGEEVTDDDGLLEVVTSANVACGFHAGTPAVMRRVCAGAAERGVRVGAQVSYRDREGFGRRRMDVAPDVLAAEVEEQVSVLGAIAEAEGVVVTYVKPHGALYNRVVDDEEQAAAVLAGSGDLPVLGLPGGALLRLAGEQGRATYTEGFPDRGYEEPDERGVARLVPRDRPGAVLEDPDRDRAARGAARARRGLGVRARRRGAGRRGGTCRAPGTRRRRAAAGGLHVTESADEVRVRPYGEAALLLEVPADRVLATYDAVLGVLADRTDVSAREVVPAARTILVAGLRGLDAGGLLAALAESHSGPRAGAAARGRGADDVRR